MVNAACPHRPAQVAATQCDLRERSPPPYFVNCDEQALVPTPIVRFARDASNKLVRQRFWLDMTDRTPGNGDAQWDRRALKKKTPKKSPQKKTSPGQGSSAALS